MQPHGEKTNTSSLYFFFLLCRCLHALYKFVQKLDAVTFLLLRASHITVGEKGSKADLSQVVPCSTRVAKPGGTPENIVVKQRAMRSVTVPRDEIEPRVGFHRRSAAFEMRSRGMGAPSLDECRPLQMFPPVPLTNRLTKHAIMLFH